MSGPLFVRTAQTRLAIGAVSSIARAFAREPAADFSRSMAAATAIDVALAPYNRATAIVALCAVLLRGLGCDASDIAARLRP